MLEIKWNLHADLNKPRLFVRALERPLNSSLENTGVSL